MKRICPFDIGDVYITGSNVNPADKWAGTTWNKIEGRFLFASDSSHEAGTTGGASSHALSVDELPSHAHTVPAHGHGHSIKAKTPKFTHSVTQPAFNTPKLTHSVTQPTVNGGAVTNGITGGSHTHSSKGYCKHETDKGAWIGLIANGESTAYTVNSSTHTHNLPAHTHSVSGGKVGDHAAAACTRATNVGVGDHAASDCTMSGSVTDKAAFDTNPTGGGRRSRCSRRTSSSTCGSERPRGLVSEGGIAMGSVIGFVGCCEHSAACAGSFGCGKAA